MEHGVWEYVFHLTFKALRCMPRDGGMKTGFTWWNTFLVHVKQTLEWVQRGVFFIFDFFGKNKRPRCIERKTGLPVFLV